MKLTKVGMKDSQNRARSSAEPFFDHSLCRRMVAQRVD